MGLGKWCFVEAEGDVYGPPLFYPFLREHGLALAFQNPRWNGETIMKMENGFVLCWCPAGYVWPYCMLCGKFCFPYYGDHSHMNSEKHLRRLEEWRLEGREKTIAKAAHRYHKHRPFFLQEL